MIRENLEKRTHLPGIGVFKRVRELGEKRTIDEVFSRLRTDDGAYLVVERDILISGALRDEGSALSTNRPELVGEDSFEAISERLQVMMTVREQEQGD